MTGHWDSALRAAANLADGRDAIRLANLAIASHLDALRRPGAQTLSPLRLRDRVRQLAIEDFGLDQGGVGDWRRLTDSTRDAAMLIAASGNTDDWVQAFQASDPSRKARGAFATPAALAHPMADLLLADGQAPRRVLDPAVGCGALLSAVLARRLRGHTEPRTVRNVTLSLHGYEVDPLAREVACLVLWLQAGPSAPPLAAIARRVQVGNALTRSWDADPLFDAVIMNPPWESLRHAAGPVGSPIEAERVATLERLASPSPHRGRDLPPLFSLQGTGDRNLYKAFLELVPHLMAPDGRLVALIPGAWSSDMGTRDLRRLYLHRLSTTQWTCFENRQGHFPIDGRYKFGVLVADRTVNGAEGIQVRAFASDPRELGAKHVRVPLADLKALGGPAESIPDVSRAGELRLMLRFKRERMSLFDPLGPFGPVKYQRELDLTEDRKRGRIARLEDLNADRTGVATWHNGERTLVPVVEGRMVGPFDFCAKSWVSGRGRTAKWSTAGAAPLSSCQPQFLADAEEGHPWRVAICDVTSATNTRTVLATRVPSGWRCGNTAPTLCFVSDLDAWAGAAVLNSLTFDWQARRTMAGLHLNKFYLEALTWPALSDESIGELAALSQRLHARLRHWQDLGMRPSLRRKRDAVVALCRIEEIVLEGFQVSATDRRRVFANDASDRRGHWRLFATDPVAAAVAEQMRAS